MPASWIVGCVEAGAAYRWRLSLADGEGQYDELEARLFEGIGHNVPQEAPEEFWHVWDRMAPT